MENSRKLIGLILIMIALCFILPVGDLNIGTHTLADLATIMVGLPFAAIGFILLLKQKTKMNLEHDVCLW